MNNTEPLRITNDDILSIQEELIKREPIFHRLEWGTTRTDFENMTDVAFWEVGASGHRYSREFVWSVLEERYKNPSQDSWEAEDFYCQEIAPNNYLLTYKLHQGERVTQRSTLWRHSNGYWKIVYHQGTIVEKG